MNKTDTMILANLKPHDFKRLAQHHIPYSGSTGPCDPSLYKGNVAPYVASFIEELMPAIKALRWHDVSVEREHGQWIVRRYSEEKP